MFISREPTALIFFLEFLKPNNRLNEVASGGYAYNQSYIQHAENFIFLTLSLLILYDNKNFSKLYSLEVFHAHVSDFELLSRKERELILVECLPHTILTWYTLFDSPSNLEHKYKYCHFLNEEFEELFWLFLDNITF